MYRILEASLESLTSPALRKAMLLAALASLLVVATLAGGLTWLVLNTTIFNTVAWAEVLVDVLTGVGAWVAAFLLLPIFVPLIASFWMDHAIIMVEAEYGDTTGREVALLDGLRSGLAFAGKALGLNLLVLPLYFVPVVNLVVYYTLNSWLLSREFLDAVLLRHTSFQHLAEERRPLQRRARWLGVMLSFGMSIPFINLLLPLAGAVMMTHLYEQSQGRQHVKPASMG